MMARAAAVVTIMVATASGCGTADVCPLTPDSVETDTFSGLGEDTVVFTGYAIRYVDAPDVEFRGYDLSVVRFLKGRASPEGTFLRVAREVAGIRGGQPVMIIGDPVGTGLVIEPGTCVPLIPIADEEVGARR
jgi:hypothetical protein